MTDLPPKNPFVYGRVLTASDAACPRPALEKRIKAAVRDDARLALVGDRRMGKSSAVQRTVELLKVPMLRLNFHEVMDMSDLVMRTLADLEWYIRDRSAIARKVVPWLREVGVEIRDLRGLLSGVEMKASIGLQADHLKRAFGFIRDVSERASMVLFIDELQDVRDRLSEAAGSAALAIIRGEIQQMPKCPVFFAGSARESFAMIFTSDSSPFYNHASMVDVEPIEPEVLGKFISTQFAQSQGIAPDAVQLIQAIAGQSPNDTQLLCHETWNEHLTCAGPASTASVQRALGKVLRDLTPFGEKWMSDLTAKQQRLVFAVSLLEGVGTSTVDFLTFANVRNPGEVEGSLAATLRGREALLERHGSKYHFRSRFVRLWFALRQYQVQAMIPEMRRPESYRARLRELIPALQADLLLGSGS